MHRNGKSTQPATAILEMPVIQPQAAAGEVQTAASESQAAASESQAAAGEVQTAASESQAAAGESQTAASESQAAAGESQAAARPNSPRRNTYDTKSSINLRLMVSNVAIESVLGDPKLQEILAPYGYTAAVMLQGQALHAQALALVQQQHAQRGNQYAAIDARTQAQAQAHALYIRHVGLARIAVRGDRNAAEALDLSARKRKLAGWVLQAQQFYANALADSSIIARLQSYSVTYDALVAAQALVESVAKRIVTQQNRKANAQATKRERDAALQALNRWMLDFMAVARFALADQPERLAQLGLSSR